MSLIIDNRKSLKLAEATKVRGSGDVNVTQSKLEKAKGISTVSTAKLIAKEKNTGWWATKISTPWTRMMNDFDIKSVEAAKSAFDKATLAAAAAVDKAAKAQDDYDASLNIIQVKKDLKGLYSTKEGIYTELKRCNEKKSAIFNEYNKSTKPAISDLYNSVNDIQSDIDSWYSHSRGSFIGNGGKKLPSHAMFGQSMGDLDCLKASRSNVYNKIHSLKNSFSSDINGIKSEISRKALQLNDVKADIVWLKELQINLNKSDF